jgi:hypothetical protein
MGLEDGFKKWGIGERETWLETFLLSWDFLFSIFHLKK